MRSPFCYGAVDSVRGSIKSPRIPIALDDLADMLSAVADGGIILSKVLKDPKAMPRQILLYRDFVKAVFAGT
jgi:hypothetical protein